MLKRIALAGTLLAAFVLAVACTSSGGPKKPALTPGAVTITASPAPAASASPTPGRHTITYIVTGTPATAVYGPAGSTSANTSPLHVTRPLRHPAYYEITAQMQGPGRVTCQIQVGRETVATDTAAGPLGIALCKIIPDPFTGVWTDARQEPTTG